MQTCPRCGYCPTCGRSAQPLRPWPGYPYWYQPWPGYPYWYTTAIPDSGIYTINVNATQDGSGARLQQGQ